ncbi:hypothetical protein TRFO_15630 [Tritrichomonas foetus]|uniref:Uncharacterized protein n=1 Tax=Tritrichomonas foetus TaxID=1144522 RepID=A0A1J4KSZ1_9EUKA|nr:hypothetical protein TRFO_15630 [Tritrichomonas foetus]|eukprot:OHT14000.1 hypothetical protein TRFO_15630 [Tritrichomonas foetus]
MKNSSDSPSISVIESILDSRIDQMIALTLPTDQHRQDILEAIKTTYSSSQRLSSFFDYLIDYVQTLSTKLEKTKNELNEYRQKDPKFRAKLKQHKSQKNHQEIKESIETKSDNVTNRETKKEKNNLNNNNFNGNNKFNFISKDTNNDYKDSLRLLNAGEGQLTNFINDLKQQNLRLQRLHNQDRAILLKQHAVIHQADMNDESENNNSRRVKNVKNSKNVKIVRSESESENENESESFKNYKNYKIYKDSKKHVGKGRKRSSTTDSDFDSNSESDGENGDDAILEECRHLKKEFKRISTDIQELNKQVQKRYQPKKKHSDH